MEFFVMTPWNEIDGYGLSESDTILCELFCSEVKECFQLDSSSSPWSDERIDKCCELIYRWMTLVCGESVWFKVGDIDRGTLGNMDFAVVVSAYPDKEALLEEAIRRMLIISEWYKSAMGKHDGTIEVAVCRYRSS